MTYTIYPNHLKKDKYEPFLGHTVYHIYYYTGTEYILEWNLTEKTVKRPFCCTVSILQVYFTYFCYITFWALKHHFIENLKLILKENQIMK